MCIFYLLTDSMDFCVKDTVFSGKGNVCFTEIYVKTENCRVCIVGWKVCYFYGMNDLSGFMSRVVTILSSLPPETEENINFSFIKLFHVDTYLQVAHVADTSSFFFQIEPFFAGGFYTLQRLYKLKVT